MRKGASCLSDVELLAILMGSGNRHCDVAALAERLLGVIDGKNDTVTIDDLMDIQGVGEAKATLIIAALEFARRRIRPHGLRITLPTDVYPLIRHFSDRRQEHFICISLNGAHEVIAVRTVSVGLVNRALVHPREVFADPITDRAAAIIVAHNHPSGSLIPSQDDIAVTRQLISAGETLGIRLLDHIIFNQTQHFSLVAHGRI